MNPVATLCLNQLPDGARATVARGASRIAAVPAVRGTRGAAAVAARAAVTRAVLRLAALLDALLTSVDVQ